MPQTASAKKALRSSARKRAMNDRWRRRLREALKAVRSAAGTQDTEKVRQLKQQAQSLLDRAARRHIIHPNTAARRKAQLMAPISPNKAL